MNGLLDEDTMKKRHTRTHIDRQIDRHGQLEK